MSTLLSRDNLLNFITSLGLSPEPFAEAERNELLGFAMAILEIEAMAALDPTQPHTATYQGFGNALATIAASSPNTSGGTLALRLAQHTIARVIDLTGTVAPLDGELPYATSILRCLFAAGGLVELMTTNAEPAEIRSAIRDVQQHMTAARRGLDDIKKALRAQQVAV